MSDIQSVVQTVVRQVVEPLDGARIAYCVLGDAALLLQGIELPTVAAIEIAVQWDLFPEAHQLFAAWGASERERLPGNIGRFTCTRDGVTVQILCYYNTVVAADVYRIDVQVDGAPVYVKHWQAIRNHLPVADARQPLIAAGVRRAQQAMSERNGQAWTENAYEAWTQHFGTPQDYAEKIKKDPAGRLKALAPLIGEVAGKKVINLLGSHGSKAVPMALLGARETVVVDISEQNAQYATELAAAAGVDLRYIVTDVLELPEEERTGDYDLVLMENGILHYFLDLLPLTQLIHQLLAPGGRFVLYDFHPISTKLITSKGKKHKVTGNYFEMKLLAETVAYSKLLGEAERQALPTVQLRRWTLGEIVTAVAQSGLRIVWLEEEPNTKSDDAGLPKMYALIAEKS